MEMQQYIYNTHTHLDSGLPEMTESAQVPLTSTFPSGQVHLAPVGLSRHMKSQVILRHGLGAAERARATVRRPRLREEQQRQLQRQLQRQQQQQRQSYVLKRFGSLRENLFISSLFFLLLLLWGHVKEEQSEGKLTINHIIILNFPPVLFKLERFLSRSAWTEWRRVKLTLVYPVNKSPWASNTISSHQLLCSRQRRLKALYTITEKTMWLLSSIYPSIDLIKTSTHQGLSFSEV